MTALTVAAIQGMLAVCNPPPNVARLMPAIFLHESGFNQAAIHDNTTGQPHFPPSIEAAVTLTRQLLAAGHNIDGGLGQANVTNWGWLGLSPERVFDPQTNVCASSIILAQAFDIERRALCRYATGKPECAAGYPEQIARMRAELARGQWGRAAPAEIAEITPRPKPACAAPSWDVWGQQACKDAAAGDPP